MPPGLNSTNHVAKKHKLKELTTQKEKNRTEEKRREKGKQFVNTFSETSCHIKYS